ncbi:DUF6011 domain-containing protein [Nocardioides humi]|uniref:DUF6011 domain-containing protein n=1 Tax=Nocardioides humi TaxID=449461 RepID=UPI003CCC692C
MRQERRSGPATHGPAPENSTTTTKFITECTPTDDVVRCTRCGHVVWTEESVRRELGPVCRRLVAELAGVAA